MGEKKRIVFLSGTRADFGKIKSLIEVLSKDEAFDVHIFVTGMHMEKLYGYTVNEIEKCGFENIYQYINQAGNGFMDRSLASTVVGFGDYVRLRKPDLIVVHGDRVEALSGALVGALNNVLVAHVEGGEVSGTIDELMRHATSKLSHLHFVSNGEAKKRLEQLGEESKNIYTIGSPEVDAMKPEKIPDISAVKKHYEIEFERYSILVYHPVTTSLGDVRREVDAIVEAALSSELNYVVIYPNNDHGSGIILENYERRLSENPCMKIFPSVRFEAMLSLLKNADFVLGNSSMGVREAPFLGVPTVNVGTRQNGRSKNPNIVHVNGSIAEVRTGIANAMELRGQLKPAGEFGKGNSSQRFLEAFLRKELWETGIQKSFCDA